MLFLSVILTKVFLISSHPAPAPQIGSLSEALKEEGIEYEILATEEAYRSLEKLKYPVNNFYLGEKPLASLPDLEAEKIAEEVADRCQEGHAVMTDVGSPITARIQRILAKKYPHITRIAYYENPESFVPGGYSEMAGRVLPYSQVVLFANANLANQPIYEQKPGSRINMLGKKCIGLGFSSLPQEVEKLKELRADASQRRAAFLQNHGIQDRGQKIAIYFGGANEVYYEKAFPAFLEMLSKSTTPDMTVFIQQHPRSVREGNRDGKLLEKTSTKQQVVISKAEFDEALAVADLALYYQTGANAKFVLSGIPTLQIGHETFSDILVKNGFCPSVTTAEQFEEVMKSNFKMVPDETKIYQLLGVQPDWKARFITALKK